MASPPNKVNIKVNFDYDKLLIPPVKESKSKMKALITIIRIIASNPELISDLTDALKKIIEIFNKLKPAEQEEVMSAMGVSSSDESNQTA